MSIPRFKGIPKITTTQRTTEHRFEFGYADLLRLLRLPEGTVLTVEQLQGDGDGETRPALNLASGSVRLVATVKVSS
jgi:hypothetical protein